MEIEENLVSNFVAIAQPLHASAEECNVGVFQDQAEPLLGCYFLMH